MSYDVKTAVFEGPLDLLLQLITARQLEITELSLTDLVGEYLRHLDAMRRLDLEVTSEFLLIAATLIQLKARRLLPEDAEIDLDEELALAEARDRLLSRLLACLTYRDVAAVLAHRMEATERYVGRYAGFDPGINPLPPQVRLTVGTDELADIARRLLRRRREPDLEHLDLELPSVSAAIEDIQSRVSAELSTDFDRLTAHLRRPVEVVAYFLAMLELARWGLLRATQESPDTAILIEHIKEADGRLVSEWQR
jgi:segregation and condensation protein A